MLEDHPPHDVRALGIPPVGDRSRRYRVAAATTYVTGMTLTPVLAALPLVVAGAADKWWLLAVFSFVVAWQAGLVWLLALLVRAQMPIPADSGGPV